MKVSTDALILGSWCETRNAASILDIGCGSGILTLMMLQKSTSHVYAIDIDNNAAEQASLNIAHCPWSERATVICNDINELQNQRFDLIITNPPYFEQCFGTGNVNMSPLRRQARHQLNLSSQQVFNNAARLSKTQTRLVLMYPFSLKHKILEEAKQAEWKVTNIQDVKHQTQSPPYLTLFEFSRHTCKTLQEHPPLIVKNDTDYSVAFKHLCRDFYLKF